MRWRAVNAADATWDLEVTVLDASLHLGPDEVDFGAVPIGDSAVELLGLKDCLDHDVEVTGYDAPAGFVFAPSTFTLPPQGAQDLTLVFAPARKGLVTGELVLHTSEGDHAVTIHGTGVARPDGTDGDNASYYSCLSAARGGQGAVPLALVLGYLGVRRRRRRP